MVIVFDCTFPTDTVEGGRLYEAEALEDPLAEDWNFR